MASARGFKNNVLSVRLLGRREVSVELGANPCLCKGNTTITIHERCGLYIADMHQPEARAVASIYTIIGDNVDAPRSYDNEDHESHDEYDLWLDDGDIDDDEESREDTTTAIVAHAETEANHDQWDYDNGQPMSTEDAAYMQQTLHRVENGKVTLPSSRVFPRGGPPWTRTGSSRETELGAYLRP